MGSGPMIDWPWIFSNGDDILRRLIEHIRLTGIAVGVGFVISFALSVVAHRRPVLYGPITWVAGVLYTIPSIALFVLLIPWFGLTVTTAEVALVSYTLLILVRNIVAGLRGVPNDIREAARGMGYSDRQLLWRVEVPLALPAIVAGVRVATVTTIGLVTVAALIGIGGLGHFIIDIGINRFDSTAMLLGSTLSIALAIVAEVLLKGLERWLTPWARRRKDVYA